MSKRAKPQSPFINPQQPRSATGKKPKKAISRTGKVTEKVSETTRSAIPDERMVIGIRALGFVVALFALAGAVYWAGTVQGNYPVGMVIGIVILGVIAGFGLFVAVRAKEILQRNRNRSGR